MSILAGLFCLYFVLGTEAKVRLVGGYDAPSEYGKFHASLQNLTGYHVCGGGVISLRHLVTAAHCVSGAEPSFIKVVIGTTNLYNGGYRYDVDSIIMHPKYNSTDYKNDIALLKITTLFDLRYVRILKLRQNELKEGDPVIITGFGARKPKGESYHVLQALNITIFSQDVCRYALRYSREISDKMFCTFSKIGQGTCHGDSGGPLIKDNQLVGLVAWGIPCAVGFPDVHTRIRPYINWINQKVCLPDRKTKPRGNTRSINFNVV